MNNGSRNKALAKHEARVDALFEAMQSAERLDSIANFISGLGDPLKDSGAAGRPTMDTRLHPHELEMLYVQNDLAGTIVDELVEEALRKGVKIVTDEDSTMDPMEEITEELEILDVVGDAAKWGRLYGAGYVLVVLDDGLDPSAPVELERIESVIQLVDLDLYEVTPTRWQTDLRQPGFGKPDLFRISPAHGGGMTEGLEGNQVHTSRLLKFGGTRLPRSLRQMNNGFDDSVLQRPWDAIRRFIETEQGMARIVQAFQTTTITLAGLEAILAEEGGEELIRERMKLIAQGISMINAILLSADGGEQVSRESASVAGLPDLRQGFAESVAKAARMPQTILFGTAPSGLNTDGESGIQFWHKRVHSYQTKELQPDLVWLYQMLFAAKRGPTGGKTPERWRLEWPALNEPSEREIAETKKLTADTDAIYLDRGVRTPDQVSRSRDGSAGWSSDTMPRPDLQDEELDFG